MRCCLADMPVTQAAALITVESLGYICIYIHLYIEREGKLAWVRVIRLSLGRRLVSLLPVAQRTNAFTNGVVDRPWVVGREFESHVHHENAF